MAFAFKLSDEPIYCGTCRFALDFFQRAAGAPVEYRHSPSIKRLLGRQIPRHEPDPRQISQVANPRQICDICEEPDPIWVYAVGDLIVTAERQVEGYVTRRSNEHNGIRERVDLSTGSNINLWGDRWALCATCSALLDAGDTWALVSRKTPVLPSKETRSNKIASTRSTYHGVYSELRASLEPGRGRITAENPLGDWEPAPHDATA